MMHSVKKTSRFKILLFVCMTTAFLLAGLGFLGSIDAASMPDQGEKASSGVVGFLMQQSWSPYAAGFGIGILSWFAFLFSDHPLGVSTAYARTSGMIEKSLRGPQVEEKSYYKRFPPKIDWEWMLVLGLVLGAFVSATTSGDFNVRFIPQLWQEGFGSTPFHRWLSAFGGGAIMMIGARWANGCTSGHALSGTMQLVVSSWIAAICLFGAGIATAFILY